MKERISKAIWTSKKAYFFLNDMSRKSKGLESLSDDGKERLWKRVKDGGNVRNGEKHSKPVKAIFEDGSYKTFRNHLLASAEFGMPDWLIRRASKKGSKINGVIFCRP